MRPWPFVSLLAFLYLLGCGSNDDAPAGAPDTDAGVEAGQDSQSVDAPMEATVDATLDSSDAFLDGSEDAHGDVAGDVVGDVAIDAPNYPKPVPSDIYFQAVNPIPSGEFLIFNDWTPIPNSVSIVSLDGQDTTEIFRAHRVWSLGVSRGSDRIAFSCGDPNQVGNYGLTLGDAIQHTWLYDIEEQTVEVVAFGNINDECHFFGPGDENLYVCRRYDFTNAGTFKGWRIGRIGLATGTFEYLTPEVDSVFALYPQPTLNEAEMYYGLIDVPANPPSGVRSIMKMGLPNGAPELVRNQADLPVLSPDGTKYLFRNYADGRSLWSSSLDGTGALQVVSAQITEPVWSPDGTRVAYLLRDNAANCDHIYVAAADGSEANTPQLVRDCSTTGEFITKLEWIVVP